MSELKVSELHVKYKAAINGLLWHGAMEGIVNGPIFIPNKHFVYGWNIGHSYYENAVRRGVETVSVFPQFQKHYAEIEPSGNLAATLHAYDTCCAALWNEGQHDGSENCAIAIDNPIYIRAWQQAQSVMAQCRQNLPNEPEEAVIENCKANLRVAWGGWE
jgi:hypothetical protein